MAPKTHLFRLIICSIVLVSASLELSDDGWHIIHNPNDPKLAPTVKFAVAEHNKQANKHLELVTVLKAESQVVEGMEYRFTLSAKDGGGAVGHYVAVVWEKAWEHFRKLISFERL